MLHSLPHRHPGRAPRRAYSTRTVHGSRYWHGQSSPSAACEDEAALGDGSRTVQPMRTEQRRLLRAETAFTITSRLRTTGRGVRLHGSRAVARRGDASFFATSPNSGGVAFLHDAFASCTPCEGGRNALARRLQLAPARRRWRGERMPRRGLTSDDDSFARNLHCNGACHNTIITA